MDRSSSQADPQVQGVKLQGRSRKPVVGDIKMCGIVVRYILAISEDGIYFRHGLDWNNVVIGYAGDASFAEEDQPNECTGELEPHRSQGGRILILASKELMAGTNVFFHVIGFTSSILRRACRSTIEAETFNIQYAVEAGDIIGAGIADMHGMLDHMNWEASVAAFMHAVWFTDCESARAAFMRLVQGKISDKRLGIEVASSRRSLWRIPVEDPR